MESYRNFIDGTWAEPCSGAYTENRNPADQRELIGIFPKSDLDDVTLAYEAASNALPTWQRTATPARSAILYRAADWLERHAKHVAEDLTREEGKIYTEALQEVHRAAEHFRFYAALGHLAGGHSYPSSEHGLSLYTTRQPLGVSAIIAPWNFPLSIPVRKIAPALITGNTIVFKPASETPLAAIHLTEALQDAGVPAGVFNCVMGPGSRIGDTIVSHPAVRGVSFTGSTEAGFRIQRQVAPTTRTQLELGGKNALVIMDDADIDYAVGLVIKGGYNLAGQACTGTSRVLVHEHLYDPFVEKLVQVAQNLRIGDGRQDGIELGPLVSQRQKSQVLDYIKIGRDEGVPLLTGGEAVETGDYRYGFFVTPAVFAPLPSTSRLFREEIFGPVLGVTAFANLNEAIYLVNDSEYGLVASICTNRLRDAYAFAEGVDVGMVKVNRTTTGLAMNAPFGGWKNSSTASFREEGKEAMDFFTKEKTVFMGWQP